MVRSHRQARSLRHFAQFVFLALGALPFGWSVAQPSGTPQVYPTRAIRLIAGTAPGGITDFLARTAAESLSRSLGQQVVVEDRAGAAGNVAAEAVAKAPADGYTLLMVAAGNIVINPFLYRSLPFDPVNDLAPVFNMAEAPQLLVVPDSLPVTDLQEFIALAKAKPGAINYASSGSGHTTHLAGDHFARLAGVQLVHVPYKGVGGALADLLAGRVQMLSVGLGPVQLHLRSGALKALVAASKKRLPALPGVPTSEEAGLPGYEMTTWFGLFAPRGTSVEIVRVLNRRLQTMIDDPKVRKRLADAGIDAVGGSPQAFAEQIRADLRAWEQVVKASGVKLD